MHARKWLIAFGVLGVAATAAAVSPMNFGLFRDGQLDAHSVQLFGIVSPVAESSTESIGAVEADADPTKLVTLAKGLKARVVSANANLGPNIDMMALWPNDTNPTHIIACNEEDPGDPNVQRIRLSTGVAETILTGVMDSCDPVRRTPWGTIIVGEEAGSAGRLFEILDPLANPIQYAERTAVGRLSFEGIGLFPNGVMYYGDENRPGSGTPGGAYFKFIPTTLWSGGAPISDLSQSPLASGTVYGLRLGRRNGNTDWGQGTETGLGIWVPVPGPAPANLRSFAAAQKLTGYYRPEDIDIDGAALTAGLVRICGNNTGNEGSDRSWGNTICVTDGTLAQAATYSATPASDYPEVQYLVIGNPELAMMDNIAYQPGRGNWIIHEDGDGPEVGRNNDLWSCLDDGDDVDTLSDGCVRIGTINDLNAEWTGGFFDGWGQHFYVSVQHNVTGHGVILDITGWR